MITLECRHNSFEKTDRQTRYNKIIDVLKKSSKPLTARQIAYGLNFKDLNAVKPRLTELVNLHKVRVCDKAYDGLTQRHVATYEVM